MKAFVKKDSDLMVVRVEGEVNTLTTPDLAKEVEDLSGVKSLVFDLDLVDYVSSAGLRLFLACQRAMNEVDGTMLITNCNYLMYEIFESVGYNKIMNIEKKDANGENLTNSK